MAWVFLCLFLKKFEIGQCFSPFPPEAQSSVAGLHSGLGSTNICSSWVPSAPFLCPSGAGGIIKLLLFILHSILSVIFVIETSEVNIGYEGIL